MRIFVLLLMSAIASGACNGSIVETQEQYDKRRAREQWESPCQDESMLLATTSGSPSHFRCPNPKHRMVVQVATSPTNEEAAALVFCKCERDGDASP